MEQDKIQTFVMTAEDDLASVRSSLLIVAQTGDSADLSTASSCLARLKDQSIAAEMPALATLCGECEETLEQLAATGRVSPGAVYAALDIVARIEAAVWDVPLHSEDFLADIAGFVESSFDRLLPRAEIIESEESEEFEIDEETLDIFRSEADEILSNIAGNLGLLSIAPDDQNALWEVRRNAHTLKGAAGIVGLRSAAEVAHRMEDLLDKIVELRGSADADVVEFLVASSRRLNAICAARPVDDEDDALDSKYAAAVAALSIPRAASQPTDELANIATSHSPMPGAVKTTTPIVRVSLDRLDDLIKLSNSMIVNQAAMSERFSEIELLNSPAGSVAHVRFERLLEVQRTLTGEMQTMLLQVRMVKFGTLETRLSRNINVTCTDEGKRAVLELENAETEIDTQVIDALIEPLLHLLKNAVVHGIESPETRRLIGKPERGSIRVRLTSDSARVRISVTDDGGGISAAKLREKAVAVGLLTDHQADSMNDRDAMQLIFDRGLTTAAKVDMNAGRGVGMSIAKDAIESRGGEISFESVLQRGTTFTITMPVHPIRPDPTPAKSPETIPCGVAGDPLVLIVDDSSSIRRHAAKLAEEAGFRVITANNGAEALELLLNGNWEPDLIMSDVEMPQIDGWEFLEYVKTDEHFGHIPVVMVTSLNAETHRQRAFELGASDYVIKPLKPSDISRIAASITRKDSSEPEACLA